MPMTEVSQDGVGTMTGLDEVVVSAGDAFGSGAVQRTPCSTR